jgi:hypothetical protein
LPADPKAQHAAGSENARAYGALTRWLLTARYADDRFVTRHTARDRVQMLEAATATAGAASAAAAAATDHAYGGARAPSTLPVQRDSAARATTAAEAAAEEAAAERAAADQADETVATAAAAQATSAFPTYVPPPHPKGAPGGCPLLAPFSFSGAHAAEAMLLALAYSPTEHVQRYALTAMLHLTAGGGRRRPHSQRHASGDEKPPPTGAEAAAGAALAAAWAAACARDAVQAAGRVQEHMVHVAGLDKAGTPANRQRAMQGCVGASDGSSGGGGGGGEGGSAAAASRAMSPKQGTLASREQANLRLRVSVSRGGAASNAARPSPSSAKRSLGERPPRREAEQGEVHSPKPHSPKRALDGGAGAGAVAPAPAARSAGGAFAPADSGKMGAAFAPTPAAADAADDPFADSTRGRTSSQIFVDLGIVKRLVGLLVMHRNREAEAPTFSMAVKLLLLLAEDDHNRPIIARGGLRTVIGMLRDGQGLLHENDCALQLVLDHLAGCTQNRSHLYRAELHYKLADARQDGRDIVDGRQAGVDAARERVRAKVGKAACVFECLVPAATRVANHRPDSCLTVCGCRAACACSFYYYESA